MHHCAVVPRVVHFLNILTNKAACYPQQEDELPIAHVDPSRVTCRECLRYLRRDIASVSAEGPRGLVSWCSED